MPVVVEWMMVVGFVVQQIPFPVVAVGLHRQEHSGRWGAAVGFRVGAAAADDEDVACRMAASASAHAASVRSDGGSNIRYIVSG